MEVISEYIAEQIPKIFKNLQAVYEAARGSLTHIVKFNIFMTTLFNFATVNGSITQYVKQPYAARAAMDVR